MNEKLLFTFGLIVTLFYVPMVIMTLKRLRQKQARRMFFAAVKSVMDRVADDTQALEQIIIAYRKLSEQFPHIALHYRSPRDFIEDYLFRMDALGESGFKSTYSLAIEKPMQQRLFAIIGILRDRDPFAALSSSYGNLLGLVRQAVHSQNVELAQTTLKQLADELEITEKTIRSQDKRNTISIAVSAVGVILTIVFGALSLVPLITAKIDRSRADSAVQQSAPLVSGTRGAPPAGAGGTPQVPSGEP